MKHTFKLAALSMLCANAFAAPAYLPIGPNLTYGAVSNNQTIISNVTNPAAGAAVFTKEDSQYRFGILSSIGGGYEVGQVEDLKNQFDSTIKKLTEAQSLDITQQAVFSSPGVFNIPATAANIVGQLNSLGVDPTNALMNSFQKEGFLKTFFSIQAPFTPFVVSHKGLGGSFVLDANASAVGAMSFISDPIAQFSATDPALLNPSNYSVNGTTANLNFTLPTSDSTFLVKGAVIYDLALGYSRPVVEQDIGNLYVGFKANYYKVGLTRIAQRLQSLQGKNSNDAFKNNDQNRVYSSGFGLDIGTLWISKNYRVGAWLDNVNKPSFKFNEIDVTAYSDAAVKAELSKSATYEMSSQLHLEGALYTESQNWVINVGADANAVKDPVGNEYQWGTISAAYATDSWWIPGFRTGYRTNMAGTKLSYLTGGLTLFKSVTLDVAYGLDSVEIDGQKGPRSAMASLGLELTF